MKIAKSRPVIIVRVLKPPMIRRMIIAHTGDVSIISDTCGGGRVARISVLLAIIASSDQSAGQNKRYQSRFFHPITLPCNPDEWCLQLESSARFVMRFFSAPSAPLRERGGIPLSIAMMPLLFFVREVYTVFCSSCATIAEVQKLAVSFTR